MGGGSEAFVIASGWPSARIDHWQVLLRARAIENQCWVIACNEVGTQDSPEGPVRLGGHSSVIAPTGELLVEGGDQEEILFATVEPALVQEVRAAFPVLRDIRTAGLRP